MQVAPMMLDEETVVEVFEEVKNTEVVDRATHTKPPPDMPLPTMKDLEQMSLQMWLLSELETQADVVRERHPGLPEKFCLDDWYTSDVSGVTAVVLSWDPEYPAHLGVSVCNLEEDEYNERRGFIMAINRALHAVLETLENQP